MNRPRPAVAAIACAVLAFVVTLDLVGVARAQSLAGRLRAILDDPKLGVARTGVVIMDAATGDLLASRREDEAFIPASNMKILTSGAALAVLGRDFVFETTLLYDPAYRAEQGSAGPAVTGGRIVLRGGGDPALGDPKILEQSRTSVEWILDTWVNAMTRAGVPAGAELVIDDRVFDRQFVHPSWPTEQLTRWYCAEVCGLNFHTNLLAIYTDPREPGRPPAARTDPASPWLDLRNRARSIKQGNHTAWVARGMDNSITLHGDVRFANDPVEVSLSNMPEFLARLIADRMTAAGIRPARLRPADANEDLSAGQRLHTFTTDMTTVLRRCNVDSYNLYAECLFKRLGYEVTRAPGSWSNGAAVMRMVLQEHLGIDAGKAFTVADGSGMSRNNRVTPRMLALWLKAMADDDNVEHAFIASLPAAGEEGTLRRRFRARPLRHDVRAKTGYLSGVSAVSGYVTDTATGRRLIFSVITNDKPNKVQLSAVREAEERVIALADAWLSGDTNPGAAGIR